MFVVHSTGQFHNLFVVTYNLVTSQSIYCSKSYLLTPWSRVLLEKLTGFKLVKKFPAFYGTRRFITAVTTARHLSLSWASSTQSIPPHSTSWISILILSSLLRLGLTSVLFPSGFPTKKTLYTPLLSPIRAICPAHLNGYKTRWRNLRPRCCHSPSDFLSSYFIRIDRHWFNKVFAFASART